MNAGAKLLRQHGLLARGAISSLAADDADGRDRELAEKHLLQLRHTVAVGFTSGKPAVHVISNAFVGSKSNMALMGSRPAVSRWSPRTCFRRPTMSQVCKINFLVKKTGSRALLKP